jgi:hypothetical protein
LATAASLLGFTNTKILDANSLSQHFSGLGRMLKKRGGGNEGAEDFTVNSSVKFTLNELLTYYGVQNEGQ